MFTLLQIKEAHAKVKTGADFPNYIKELIGLGVTHYETFVSDGHTIFNGNNDYRITTESKYANMIVSDVVDVDKFKMDLIAHQQGKTDYMTFCNNCAESGVEKWGVSMKEMTCTYFDKKGNDLLQESIPQ